VTNEELKDIVRKGEVVAFNVERRYIVVLDYRYVKDATTSQLASQLRRMGVKAAVLLADFVEGRNPPLQVFEMKEDQ
jgi:hypothetical protein